MKLKKRTKLQLIKDRFYYDEEGNIKLRSYGVFNSGLTHEEIKNYLRARANKISIERVYKKFIEIAGINTCPVVSCPNCNKEMSLMYRHDVQRFADVLFLGISTYWD